MLMPLCVCRLMKHMSYSAPGAVTVAVVRLPAALRDNIHKARGGLPVRRRQRERERQKIEVANTR
jgi:hypothetical protein